MIKDFTETSASDIDFDSDEDFKTDFSSVKTVGMSDICKISDLQAIAALNGKKLYIKNANPEVSRFLISMGMRDLFENFEDLSLKLVKRFTKK